jgi:hypothetical protein
MSHPSGSQSTSSSGSVNPAVLASVIARAAISTPDIWAHPVVAFEAAIAQHPLTSSGGTSNVPLIMVVDAAQQEAIALAASMGELAALLRLEHPLGDAVDRIQLKRAAPTGNEGASRMKRTICSSATSGWRKSNR